MLVFLIQELSYEPVDFKPEAMLQLNQSNVSYKLSSHCIMPENITCTASTQFSGINRIIRRSKLKSLEKSKED